MIFVGVSVGRSVFRLKPQMKGDSGYLGNRALVCLTKKTS